MSIARVRIAPIEQWCPDSLQAGAVERGSKIVGLVVEIIPSSMVVEECRKWILTDESMKSLHERAQTPHEIRARSGHKICEHMLEMD